MDALFGLLKEFDFDKLLPEMDTFLGKMTALSRLFVLLGPILVLALGAVYFFRPSKSPRGFGFRSYYVTGSSEAWRFAQRFAGMSFMILGGVLTVVMLVVSLFFGGMDAVGMATAVLVCVCVELAMIVGVHVLINLQVLKYFDKDGNRK